MNIENQKRLITITISLVFLIIIGMIIAAVAYFISHSSLLKDQATQIAIISVVVTAVIGFISLLFTYLHYLQFQNAMRREKISTRAISMRVVIEEAPSTDTEITTGTIGQLHQREAEKLELMKQQVQVQEKQLDLEKEKLSLEWQKEAVMFADISPQAAIIIAWAGIELEIQRAIEQLAASSEQAQTVNKSVRSSLMDLELLSQYNRIDSDTMRTLKDMRDLRNKVAHGLLGKAEIRADNAVDYVQKAISIAQKISSSQN